MHLHNDHPGGVLVNRQGSRTARCVAGGGNFVGGRVDHDFGQNWRLMTIYRYYKFNQFTSNQVDIGGVLPGDTLGMAAGKSQKPQTPSYWVAGLNGVFTPPLINDFHYSYLRNAWQWSSAQAPPQLPGLGGAIEIAVDNVNSLVTYPV